MKAKSRTLMKISMANRLVTSNGSRMRTATSRQSQSTPGQTRPRIIAPLRRPGRSAETQASAAASGTPRSARIGADELYAEQLRDTHHQTGDQRAFDIAQCAQDDGHERHQHEHLTGHRRCRVERHQQRAGGAGERSDTPTATQNTRLGLMPISIATSGFCAAARMALPMSVLCRKTQRVPLSAIASTKAMSFATGI